MTTDERIVELERTVDMQNKTLAVMQDSMMLMIKRIKQLEEKWSQA